MIKTAQELIEIVDGFSQKISDEEYRTLCNKLNELSKQKDTRQLYKVSAIYILNEKKPVYDAFGSVYTKFRHYRIESSFEEIEWYTTLKKCDCDEDDDCEHEDLYKGEGNMDLYDYDVLDIFEHIPREIPNQKGVIQWLGRNNIIEAHCDIHTKLLSILLKTQKVDSVPEEVEEDDNRLLSIDDMD